MVYPLSGNFFTLISAFVPNSGMTKASRAAGLRLLMGRRAVLVAVIVDPLAVDTSLLHNPVSLRPSADLMKLFVVPESNIAS